jgi:hypothetical protein
MWRPPRNLIMIASPTSARKRSKPINKRVILALGDLHHVNATTKPSGFFHATMKPEGFWILTRGHSSSPEIGSSGAAQSGAPTKTVAISTLTLQTRGYCRLSAKPMRTAGTRSAVAATSRPPLSTSCPERQPSRVGGFVARNARNDGCHHLGGPRLPGPAPRPGPTKKSAAESTVPQRKENE